MFKISAIMVGMTNLLRLVTKLLEFQQCQVLTFNTLLKKVKP